MKCPMQTVIPKATPTNLTIDFFECLKEECAWWQKDGEQCGFKSIDNNLDRIADYLKAILENMPHAGQFTK